MTEQAYGICVDFQSESGDANYRSKLLQLESVLFLRGPQKGRVASLHLADLGGAATGQVVPAVDIAARSYPALEHAMSC